MRFYITEATDRSCNRSVCCMVYLSSVAIFNLKAVLFSCHCKCTACILGCFSNVFCIICKDCVLQVNKNKISILLLTLYQVLVAYKFLIILRFAN